MIVQNLGNTKKPRVNYLQACQWGVCSDISDKGTAVSVNERHKSVHDTIKDKGTAAVIPLNYLPVRGMHQDRRQRSRRWGLHSCQGGFDHFSSQLEVDYSIYSRERFSLSMWSLTIWSTISFSLPRVFEHTSHFTPGSALSAWTCCIWDIKPPCVWHNFSHIGHL